MVKIIKNNFGWYVKCPRLSTRGEWGFKFGSNLVHVVVECPLSGIMKVNSSL